jgi:Tfp pilus assembly protein PilE
MRNPSVGLGVLDTILVVLLVAVLIVLVIPYYQSMLLESRKLALTSELINIRQAIRLFEYQHQRSPQDLRELVRKKFIEPARHDTFFEWSYLEPNAVDSQGRPLDPFGQVYTYDPVTGHVYSQTKGYEGW